MWRIWRLVLFFIVWKIQLLYQYNQPICKLTTVHIHFYWIDGVWDEWQISNEPIKLKRLDVLWVVEWSLPGVVVTLMVNNIQENLSLKIFQFSWRICPSRKCLYRVRYGMHQRIGIRRQFNQSYPAPDRKFSTKSDSAWNFKNGQTVMVGSLFAEISFSNRL